MRFERFLELATNAIALGTGSSDAVAPTRRNAAARELWVATKGPPPARLPVAHPVVALINDTPQHGPEARPAAGIK
jgi:hypothetical protein